MDNIELRSEKVRNIIGKMPPIIIRIGISVVFILVVGIILAAYFVKYDYRIETTGKLIPMKEKHMLYIYLPVTEQKKVKTGQTVFMTFAHRPNLYQEQLKTTIYSISDTIQVNENKAFYQGISILPKQLTTLKNKKLHIKSPQTVNITIQVGKMSFIERIKNLN